MGTFDAYNIQLKAMPLGSQVVSYHLDNTFFEAIGEESIQKGSVDVRVTVDKTTRQSELSFEVSGKVIILCDRCLEEMDQPINTTGHLIVRMGKEFKDEGDDIVVVPEEQGIINVSWFMYEFIQLAIPIKHVHPFGRCNTGMASKLSKHLVSSRGFEDEELDNLDELLDEGGDIAAPSSAKEALDPRWEALRGFSQKD